MRLDPSEIVSAPRSWAAHLIVGGLLLLSATTCFYFIAHHLNTVSLIDKGQAIVKKMSAQLLMNHLGGELLGISCTLGEENSAMKAVVTGQTPALALVATLQRICKQTKASVVYVMDAAGNVVASTTYDGGKSLTGNNYAFRPYFQEAMKGRDIVYPALGVTTNKRGIYFASPVRSEKNGANSAVLGVIVLKKGLAGVDDFFSKIDRPAALLSPEGVVFAANRPEWMFRPFFNSDISKTDQHQFGEGKAPAEPIVQSGAKPFEVRLQERPFLFFASELKLTGSRGQWRLILLEDPSHLVPGWFKVAVLIAVLASLGAISVGILMQRGHLRQGDKLPGGLLISAAAVSCAGVFFFLSLYVVARKWEERRMVNMFVNQAEAMVSILSGELESLFNELDMMARYAAWIGTIGPEDLAEFITPIFNKHVGFESIHWAERQGASPIRTSQFPIHFSYPTSAPAFSAERNLAADVRFAPLFNGLIDENVKDMVLIPLEDSKASNPARLAVAIPIVDRMQPSYAWAGSVLPKGIMILIVDPAQVLEHAFIGHLRGGLHARVTSSCAAGKHGVMLYDSTQYKAATQHMPEASQLSFHQSITAADSCWDVVLTAGPKFIDIHQVHYGPGILGMGILLTVIATAYVIGSGKRRHHVERLVHQRTLQVMQNEKRTSTILESIQAGVAIIDRDNHSIVYINRAAAHVSGWDKNDLEGRLCHDLICPNRKDSCPMADPDLRVENAERELIRKDGSTVPILKTVKPIILNNRNCYIETFVDITALKQAEQALGRSERNYRLLFEAASDAVILLDGGCIYDVNESALKIFGFEQRDDIIGKHPSDLSPQHQPGGGESHTLAEAHMQKTLLQESTRFDWTHQRLDGETFAAEVSLKSLELDGRHVIQAVVRDITKRKAHEKRLAETLEELERFNKVMMEREGRVLELKAQINALMVELGRKPAFRTAGAV